MGDIRWQGQLKIRRIPAEWSRRDYEHWWLPRSVDPLSGLVRIPARMSEEEKDGLTIWRGPNTLLVAGVNNVLSYIVAQGAGPGVMFQYMAVGNGSILGVVAGATTLAGEFARKAITSASNFGSVGQVSVLYTASDGVGTWTNVGWFGINATATANSGVLMSQVLILPPFFKSNVAQYTQDYDIALSSN